MTTLPRTGQRPITFHGDSVATASSKWLGTQEQNRWFELELYAIDGDRYVLHIGYRTQWQGELAHDVVEVCNDLDAVATELRNYDPTYHVGGFPVGPHFADKQARLLSQIQRGYQQAITELMADYPESL